MTVTDAAKDHLWPWNFELDRMPHTIMPLAFLLLVAWMARPDPLSILAPKNRSPQAVPALSLQSSDTALTVLQLCGLSHDHVDTHHPVASTVSMAALIVTISTSFGIATEHGRPPAIRKVRHCKSSWHNPKAVSCFPTIAKA
jgi:hypothetical protein